MHIYAGSCSDTDLSTGTSRGPLLNMSPQLHILRRGPAPRSPTDFGKEILISV